MELEKILEEIEKAKGEPWYRVNNYDVKHKLDRAINRIVDIIRKHMNDGWISVEDRLPEEKRANYEVTFINECGYEEHGFAQWYDGEFHIPAVVIAWRDHLNPYCPEKR